MTSTGTILHTLPFHTATVNLGRACPPGDTRQCARTFLVVTTLGLAPGIQRKGQECWSHPTRGPPPTTENDPAPMSPVASLRKPERTWKHM